MSRDDGFPVADRDTGTLRDPKVVRAFRKGGFAAVLAWDAIVDASWEEGERVTLEEAVISLPYGLDPDALLPILIEVELVGADGLIVEETWERWFRPAWERRENRRRSGRLGGARSWKERRQRNGEATLKHRSSDAEAMPNPSVRPSNKPSALAGAREDAPSDPLPHITDAVGAAWTDATGRSVIASGEFAIRTLDDLCERQGEDAVLAAIPIARGQFPKIPSPQQLAAALRNRLEPLPKGQPEEIRPAPPPRRPESPPVDEVERQRILRELTGATP